MLRAIFARHARSARNATEFDPASEHYPDLTGIGVYQAKKAAEQILFNILLSEPGTAFLVACNSDQPRTKQTALIFADKTELGAKAEVPRFRPVTIDARHFDGSQDGGLVPVGDLVSKARIGKENRVVLAYPVYTAEFAYDCRERWTFLNPMTGKQEKTPYFDELLKKHHNNHANALHDWLQNRGELVQSRGYPIIGPTPQQVALDYLAGLVRTHQSMNFLFPDREVVVVAVGRQWDLDALATLLAFGQVTYENWKQVMGRPDADPEDQVIGECELLTNITFEPETGKSTVTHRGKDFSATITDPIAV